MTQFNTQQMLSTLHHDFAFSPKDNFLHHSSICFDLSVVQIFSALTCGGTVLVASAEVRKDPARLANFAKDAGVTVSYSTPTQFALLLEHASDALRQCSGYRVAFFAGERLPVRLVKAFYDLKTPATIYNTWSPSELVVQTTISKVQYPENDDVNIPIGFPLANCRHYIVDSNMKPLPPTLVGEICVSGAQVGAGYLNRPDVNRTSFIENPFCSEDDRIRSWTRLFRTGDKGRFRPDTQLEFHGRIAGDKQIKLRGFRIDLGEVEHRIHLETLQMKTIRLIDISVVARTIQAGSSALTDERQLVAYLVPNRSLDSKQKTDFVTALQERIGKQLNPYMLPNGYQFLESLPTTIGGKVDRQNLLTRNLELTFVSSQSSKGESSEDSVDQAVLDTVTDLFKDILRFSKEREIEPTDNFFNLGGQSVLLLRLQSKLKRKYKTTPSLPELFKASTPLEIAQRICGKKPAQDSKDRSTDSSEQKVNWREEAQLPMGKQYSFAPGTQPLRRSDVENILITGADSFIGVHLLAKLLATQSSTNFYILGSESRAEFAGLLKVLRRYKLLDDKVTEAALNARTKFIP